MIISISDVWDKAASHHLKYIKARIGSGLIDLGKTPLERKIYQFIRKNKRVISSGSAKELGMVVENFNSYFESSEVKGANKILKKIFNYSAFSRKNKGQWNAYKLCDFAKYKTCCYCHLVKIGTSLPGNNGRGYRPPIDHFYPQHLYPFLSLSLSNFIPCCEKCNSSQMKGTADFSKVPHLNPLLDEESIIFLLASKAESNQSFAEGMSLKLPKEQYYLELKVIKNHNISMASLATFQLVNRYQDYAGQAYHLARNIKSFVARKKVLDRELEFDVSLDDILGFSPEEYRTEAYGKARICIANQFENFIE